MDTIALLDIIKPIDALLVRYQPDTVFTHHAGDLNVDHRSIHEAVVTAYRPQREHSVKMLLCVEMPSSTKWQLPGSAPVFTPNWFVDIPDTLVRKLVALNTYAAELRDWSHSRSRRGVESLARWRDAMVGVDAAEAFMLGWKLT